ncbi:uncharacterized protein [Cicer arietinum]|uniref:DNA-3-methyladenine glycosylase II n=1 Tax=Cicer arietinum TaxID=3827 RepID=A0A1S3E0J5_CICAR|nr:DNA-3-methyladenine glycosylase isoform X2 [Cicer arietinum]
MHLHMQLCRMSFPRSTRTTLERESTSESSSSLFDSFRYHATVMTPKKQRFKRVSKPILHSSRTKPALKTRRSKLVKFTTEPNPSSEPHISLGNFETLPREFFQIDALDLAPRLLGKFLRRDDVVLQITEVEAYRPNDSACHGRFGITPRTAPVFGPGGHAYVYLCYGLHMMLNIVADKEGAGAAVLVRSCAPISGLDVIQQRRGQKTDKPILLTGPGKSLSTSIHEEKESEDHWRLDQMAKVIDLIYKIVIQLSLKHISLGE